MRNFILGPSNSLGSSNFHGIRPPAPTSHPKMRLNHFSVREALPVSSSAAHISLHDRKNLSQFYSRFGLISVLVIISPLLVFAVFVCVRNWGFWRLRIASGVGVLGGVPYRRKQYIRTWHGWVEKAKIDASDVRVRPRRRLLNWIYPKMSLADLHKIFWDAELPHVIPEGPRHKEHWTRRLLWWIGWYQYLEEDPEKAHMAMARHKPVSGPAILSGLPASNTQARSSGVWLRGARNDYEINAARRRKVSIPAIKLANSNAELRLSPPKTRERMSSPQESLTLTAAKLQRMSRQFRRNTNPERPSPSQKNRQQVDLNSQPRSGRSNSAPLLSASKLTIGSAPEERSRTGHEVQYQSQEPRPPGAPPPPKNSEDTLTPLDLRILSRISASRPGGPEARTPEYIDGPRGPGYEQEFADNLTRRLEIWASPMLVNPFTSGDDDLTGIAARRSSPAMGWRIVEDAEPTSPTHQEGGEAKLHKQWWKRDRLQAVGASEVLDENEALRMPGTGDKSRSDRRQASGAAKSIMHSMHRPSKCSFTHITPLPDATSSSILRATRRPDRTLFTSLPRIFPRHPSSYTPLLSSEEQIKLGLCSTERDFLAQVDRRLKWLAYELSAGFRGPEDNPAEGFQKKRHSAFAGTNVNAVSRVTERRKLQLTNSYESLSSVNFKVPVRRRILMPNIDSWRVSVNKFRRMMTGDEQLTTRPQFGSETEEPREGDIDTAAWVLRRPPQGFPTPTAQKQAPLVGRWGKIAIEAEPPILEHHYDWERIRRPSTVKRIAKRRVRTLAKRKFAHTKARARETKDAIIHTKERAKGTTEALLHSVMEHHIARNAPAGHRSLSLRRRLGTGHSAEQLDTHPGLPEIPNHEIPQPPVNISALAAQAPPEASDGRRVVSRGRNPFANLIDAWNASRLQQSSTDGHRRPSIRSSIEPRLEGVSLDA
ncbi:hypothetical protein L228DRAFT_283849 [Xylona heveae TC161]|uniref:Uncharacterized protein n=1 Tax=Xylona heveae (strain CBS 132557 / TC161) TaxID=1328760 RepID=A0A165G461_XYLHT|nr:hypothetical protein L228DRAFT_283849 [Xylona heveae TC161]KZF21717.1 hypothetical protein L228DRAFT_283849 [Xylona heveae TC161]